MAREYRSPLDIGTGAAPLGQLRAKGGSFAALAALIVRLPLRSGVGLDILSWTNIAVVFMAMVSLNWFDNIHVSPMTFFGGGVMYGNHTALRNAAFVWAAFAIWEHFRRIDEEKRGVEPHTFSPGVSRLGLAELLPYSPKVIALAVEPALAFLMGALLRRLGFSMLGWVVILSAVCFSLSEWRFSQQLKQHRRDRRNLNKEAQWEAAIANESAGRNAGGEASDTIRTDIDGLDSDIRNRGQAEKDSATGENQ